jgi:hypothetical protein
MSTPMHRTRILALLAAAIVPASLSLAQDKPAPAHAPAMPAPQPLPVPAPAQPPNATVTPVTAQPPGALPDAIKIDSMKFDWGDISDTEPVEHVFNFTVVADKDITLAVAASCGCTVPTMEKTTYKPGETGKVTARFDPHSRQGPQTKTLTFTITNPQGVYSQQIATLTANVKALVTFDPPKMFLSEVDHMAGQKTKLTITGRKEGFQVLSVTPNNEHIKAKLGEPTTSEVNGEKMTNVVVELDVGKGAPIGTLQSQLDIKTNDDRAKLQPYFLGADVVGDIKASPAQAILRVNDPSTPFTTTVKLDSRSGSTFNILSLETDAKKEMQVVTNFEKSADGNSYTVTISGVTPAEPGMVQSFLTVSTDARGGETLRVPFTAVIRKLSQGMPAMPPKAPTSIAPVKNVLPEPHK